MKAPLFRLYLPALALSLLSAATAWAQNISQISQSDPLIITGAVGTQNTYRYSSSGNGYGSPLSNTVYANLNISLYGLSMPFSFSYTNGNTAFSYPHITFNISPTYKNWSGHIGQSSMAFSSYVMSMSFNGVGLEYNGSRFRTGAFYGTLRKAINDNPTDPFVRTPQYKRVAWGFKVGYGTDRNYLDLYLLRAYDRPNSIDDHWRRTLAPQENIAVGLKGALSPLRWFSLTANAAASVFSTNTNVETIPTKTKFDKIFDTRYSSLMRFAGDVNANFTLPFVNASVSYRMVQPDYTSLGTYYMSNNYHSLGITASTNLFRVLSLSGTFSGQEDNLTNRQLYTTCGYVYSANASLRLGSHLNISAGYNGYIQTQRDGTARVSDSTKVDRRMSGFSITPTYTLDTDLLSHSISLSANYTENRDHSMLATGESDVKTIALGASYSLGVKPWEADFSLTLSHQQSEGYHTRYTSDVASFTASRSFLEEQNLNFSATVSLCYNKVEWQSKNLSIGADFAASYTLNKVHVFSASTGFNKYGDVNITKTRSRLDMTDITVSLNYAYTFTLFEIKSKAHKAQEVQTGTATM